MYRFRADTKSCEDIALRTILLHVLWKRCLYSVCGLCTEEFCAIIPTLLYFAVLLSLHHDTFLNVFFFFIITCVFPFLVNILKVAKQNSVITLASSQYYKQVLSGCTCIKCDGVCCSATKIDFLHDYKHRFILTNFLCNCDVMPKCTYMLFYIQRYISMTQHGCFFLFWYFLE